MANENLQQTAPTTLEEAMRSIRQGDQQDPQANVGSTDMASSDQMESMASGGNDTGTPGVSDQSTAQDQFWGTPDGSDTGSINNNGDGRSSVDMQTTEGNNGSSQQIEEQGISTTEVPQSPSVSYEDIGRQYINSAQQMAIKAANDLFRENGIQKMSINDIYEKDESGRVSFVNPDDPNNPFSSRAEAQQWIDAINNQIDNEWKKYANQYYAQYKNDIQPAIDLMTFAPTYESMTKIQKDILNEIISGYEVRDEHGMAIGYSCDLNAAAQQAIKLAKKFEPQQSNQTQQQIAKPQTSPALDARTTGSGSPSSDNKNPKDLNEAMQMIANEKKAAREAKQNK